MIEMRLFDPSRDRDAVHRIWREVGWVENEDDEKHQDVFLSGARSLVADIDNQAECLVASVPGALRYLRQDIAMSAITAVTTSLVARRQGLATRLTAQLVAEDVNAGAVVSALGMFEQGFYSRLGFGTGPYQHSFRIDPATLRVAAHAAPPVRLSEANYQEVHQAMRKRWRGHGGVVLHAEEVVRAEMGWTRRPVGLGYRDTQGELTHFIWGSSEGEHGPYTINALAYRDRAQLNELMALLASLGDQVFSIRLTEPPHLQLQDLIEQPLRQTATVQSAGKSIAHTAGATWQVRINDLQRCLAQTHLPARPGLSFNLTLTDPIDKFLASNGSWRGTAGDYTVTLGEQCHARAGHCAGLPRLRASIGGFSRLWLGCASATRLATVAEIEGNAKLIDQLDDALAVPTPIPGWEF